MIVRIGALFLCLLFLAPSLRAEDTDSKAVQLYILHKYEEALIEFRSIYSEKPGDRVIQRYIGSCLAELRRDDEAAAIYDQILSEDPDDIPTLKMVAKMHLRRGRYEKAKELFEKIVSLDEKGSFSAYAKEQLEKIKALEAVKGGRAALEGRQISPDEFLKTKAATHFMDAQFEEAVNAFTVLEVTYPKDVMIKRYKGYAQDKLGQYNDAVQTFREGLSFAPENVALHYALAQSLFHKKDLKASEEELRFVAAQAGAGDYKDKAEKDLAAVAQINEIIKKAEGKPWTINIEQGFEFNENAASEPKKMQVIDEEHAVRFPGSLFANYQLRKEGPWTLSAGYGYYQAFYSDSLDYLNTLVHAPNVSVVHVGELWGRSLATVFSTSYVHVSVDEQFYYQSYPQSLRLITSFWDDHRITFSEKIAYTDYKDQGDEPADTSREGVNNTMGVSNNFYFNKKKDLYVVLGYDYKIDDVEGSEYVKNTHQLNTEFDFPLMFNWTGAVSFRYKYIDYPETNRLIQRLDEEYSAGGRITIPLNQTVNLKFTYDYLNNDSNDPEFNYGNHAGGASLACAF